MSYSLIDTIRTSSRITDDDMIEKSSRSLSCVRNMKTSIRYTHICNMGCKRLIKPDLH